MLRKPLLVHSKMVNICCQLFPSPSQMDLVQFFVSQNISTISLLVKWILKYIVYKRQRQEECFLSGDAPFAKSILFHAFTFVALHVALCIKTKYCSNKALSSSYISLFYNADASFTNAFAISGKTFNALQKIFLLLPNIDKVVSQPLRT